MGKISNKIIIISIFIFNLNYILYNVTNMPIIYKNLFRFIAVLILLSSRFFARSKIKINYIDFSWILLLLFQLLNFDDIAFNFLYIILFLILSKNTDINYIIKNGFIVSIVGLVIIISLLNLNIIQNTQYASFNRIRHTFGFKNVNAFSSYIYSLTLMFIISRNKINLYNLSLFITIHYIIYTFTDTRTTFYASMIYVVCYILLETINKVQIHLNIFLSSILIIVLNLPVFIIFSTPIIKNKFPMLDILLSYRLTLFTEYIFNNNLLNLFFGGTSLASIDSGFLIITFSIGIVFMIFLLYLINNSALILLKQKNSKFLAFIISFMYFNMSESLIVRPELVVSICFWVIVYKGLIKHKKFNYKMNGEEA